MSATRRVFSDYCCLATTRQQRRESREVLVQF